MSTHNALRKTTLMLRHNAPKYELNHIINNMTGETLYEGKAIDELFKHDTVAHIWKFNPREYYTKPPTLTDVIASLREDFKEITRISLAEIEDKASITIIFSNNDMLTLVYFKS